MKSTSLIACLLLTFAFVGCADLSLATNNPNQLPETPERNCWDYRNQPGWQGGQPERADTTDEVSKEEEVQFKIDEYLKCDVESLE